MLQVNFNYAMEDLKWVSPIVVVLKKNDINFKHLNASTEQDHFPFPFRDEFLDEIVIYTNKIMWRMWCAKKEFMLMIQRSK